MSERKNSEIIPSQPISVGEWSPATTNRVIESLESTEQARKLEMGAKEDAAALESKRKYNREKSQKSREKRKKLLVEQMNTSSSKISQLESELTVAKAQLALQLSVAIPSQSQDIANLKAPFILSGCPRVNGAV